MERILNIQNSKEFKVHLARFNGQNEPIEILASNFEEWANWTRWSGGQDHFNRKYVLSLAQYPNAKNLWLFGGIFEVNSFDKNKTPGHAYDISLLPNGHEFILRLVIELETKSQNGRQRLETVLDKMKINSVLEKPYGGAVFPGFSDLIIESSNLKLVPLEWRAILSNASGIYLLTNQESGQQYVGSASGMNGFWGRWCQYEADGHGGNKLLKELCKTLGAKPNYTMTVLEVVGSNETENFIFTRETHWKKRLGSRPHGLNEN